MNRNLGLLGKFGKSLDDRPEENKEELTERGQIEIWTPTIRDLLIRKLVRIRTKTRRTHFHLNRAQREYSRRCTKHNIVLKARQLGITTYVAARFFIQTITQPRTLSVQVAHNRESAEEIFRIVKRFWEKLPKYLREGSLKTSYCNARQIVFPHLDSEYCVTAADDNAGRGWTIQNLHCSEVSRWGRGGEEALASLRAAVVPDGEIVLEDKFKGGLSKVIDGTVECLNASSWAQAK